MHHARTVVNLFHRARVRNAWSQICAGSFARYGSQASADELPQPPAAAVLIIGDEVLSGKVTDTNMPWLANLLNSQGVDLVRAEYVRDQVEDIAQAVKRLKEVVGTGGVIFSSGGVGPTHDDVTYEAIASAFGVQCAIHDPTVKRMEEYYHKRGLEVNAARLRMATIPQPSEVLFTDGMWVPLVNIESVYILPGIPRLFQQMVEAHKERFRGPSGKTAVLYTAVGEGELADDLRTIAGKYTSVKIGSYPNTEMRLDTAEWKVKLQFDSRDGDALELARAEVEDVLKRRTRQAA